MNFISSLNNIYKKKKNSFDLYISLDIVYNIINKINFDSMYLIIDFFYFLYPNPLKSLLELKFPFP